MPITALLKGSNPHLTRDPAFDDVGFPHELEEGGVVDEFRFAHDRRFLKSLQFLLQHGRPLPDRLRVKVFLRKGAMGK